MHDLISQNKIFLLNYYEIKLMKDYYAILGVSIHAEAEVISAAYKALAKKYHPDIYNGKKKHSENIIKEINEAYSQLSNKIKKENYDKEFLKSKTTNNFGNSNNSKFYNNSSKSNPFYSTIFSKKSSVDPAVSFVLVSVLLVFIITIILVFTFYGFSGNCKQDPYQCNDNQLCEISTEMMGGERVWGTWAKEWADLAKEKGLSCNVISK